MSNSSGSRSAASTRVSSAGPIRRRFARYAIYSFIALFEVFALFMVSLSVEERLALSSAIPNGGDSMRVAALYDIHGNLPALEAVLDEIRRIGVDEILVGGDVVPGPMPRETIACLQDLHLPVRWISGNGDREVRAQMVTGSCDVPVGYRETMRWVAESLDREHEALFASWPATITLAVPGLGDVLFCHATPRNDTDIFTSETPDDRLAPAFAGVRRRSWFAATPTCPSIGASARRAS